MTDTLRAKALACLARREYSRAELARKLAPLAESEQALLQLLDELAACKQLSDARYAENRVSIRGRRYGNSRLEQELRQAGVADAAIATALADSGDETSRCQAVWQKKFGTLPATREDRVKQQNFLRYRGFSHAAIRQVLQGLDEEYGHDE